MSNLTDSLCEFLRVEVFRDNGWITWPDEADLSLVKNEEASLLCRGVEIPAPWRVIRGDELIVSRNA